MPHAALRWWRISPDENSMRLHACAALLLCALAAGTACAVEADKPYRMETVASGLEHPWCVAFLPDGRMLVTERAGRLRVIEGGKLLPDPVAGLPPAFVRGQGGLFDVLPARDFASSRVLYLSFAHGDRDANATRVVRARLDGHALKDVQVVFTAQPLKGTAAHFGGRMAWMSDGTLLLTLGDGFNHREQAQTLDNHFGKLVRINADGSVPRDNPFVDRKGALPEIYSYGHRNPQGLVVDGTRLWMHEHGPRGGDELNLIEPGRNYGWPAITYGVDYSGAQISPYTEMKGMEQPRIHWTPSIAPAGLTRYDDALFPAWRGDLLVSALVERSVRRVDLDGDQVKGQELLFTDLGERLRDVRAGPDGALYLLTDAPQGRVLRVTPARPGA